MADKSRRYSLITFPEILTELKTILAAKEGALADLGQSSYGQTLLELFAANSDLMSTWIESAFSESFLETARNNPSVYVGARSLGYSVRRSVPAKAGVGISLKRTGIYPTVKVTVPMGTTFTISGLVLTAIDDIEFSYDRNDSSYTDGVMKITSGRAVLAQGRFNEQSFYSNGTKNQEFIVSDAQFSDWFGAGDPNYDGVDDYDNRKYRFAQITSDASLSDEFYAYEGSIDGMQDRIFWRISRRGFKDPALSSSLSGLDQYITGDNATVNYTVLLTTANDGRIKLSFSDGVSAAIPFGRITCKYFTTLGETGNQLNVAGNTLSIGSSSILITQEDGTASDLSLTDLNIALTTDITGGLNIESVDSIKKNAPDIYNSLDSLGSASSYLTFIRRYADVRYANAFGESVLNRLRPDAMPDIKYSNIVRFTALKDLYRERDGKYFPTDPFEYYLQGYKVNGLVYVWQYDFDNLKDDVSLNALNIVLSQVQGQLEADQIQATRAVGNTRVPMTLPEIMQRYVVPNQGVNLIPTSIFNAQLTPMDFVETGSELYVILKQMNKAGYITLGNGQHMYVPPVVHDFTMKLDVVLFDSASFSDIKDKITTAIYEFLRDNTGFASPIYRSNLECIVQKFPEVAGLNLSFQPRPNQYEGLQLTSLTWLGEDTAQYIDQSGLSIDGFDIQMSWDYFYKQYDGSKSSAIPMVNFPISVGNQAIIQSQISDYYTNRLAYLTSNGTYAIRLDITEQELNDFTAYIWTLMLNEIYVPMYNSYMTALSNGDAITASSIYNAIETIKTWYFNGEKLSFNDTYNIENLEESASNSMYNYFVYALEYIKLVRNIFASSISSRLVDSNGNITNYSNDNEIVQFKLSSKDITLTVGKLNKGGV